MSTVNCIGTKTLKTSGFINKPQYDSVKENFEKKVEDVDKKIPNINVLVKNIYIYIYLYIYIYNTKVDPNSLGLF